MGGGRRVVSGPKDLKTLFFSVTQNKSWKSNSTSALTSASFTPLKSVSCWLQLCTLPNAKNTVVGLEWVKKLKEKLRIIRKMIILNGQPRFIKNARAPKPKNIFIKMKLK